MDLFEKKDVSPMLIGVESKAFDDPESTDASPFS